MDGEQLSDTVLWLSMKVPKIQGKTDIAKYYNTWDGLQYYNSQLSG